MERIIAGRYRLIEQVGQGSVGSVHRAYDEFLKRDVAVKLITQSADDPKDDYADELLMTEARMMARVQHPNVMPIYDFIEEDNLASIVMPLLKVQTIDFKARANEHSLLENIRFLQGIATGLDFLHTHQIIHRDLRSSSILVDDDDQPYISNFGMAQAIEPVKLSRSSNNFFGGLSYLSPEVLEGEAFSKQSDIFAFGIFVYESIAGQVPFNTGTVRQFVESIALSPFPSVGVHRAELSPAIVRDIDTIVQKLMARDPNDRYETASQAIEDLFDVLYSGQQIIDGRLFISYAHADKKFVHQLADELERYNVDVWIDREIAYGTNWDETIDKQLKACDVMLVIATPESMDSSYVTYEWSYFLGSDKAVYPFVPQSHEDVVKLHPRLSRLQYIAGTNDLAQNVRKIIDAMSDVTKKT